MHLKEIHLLCRHYVIQFSDHASDFLTFVYTETFKKVKESESAYVKGGSAPVGIFLFRKK